MTPLPAPSPSEGRGEKFFIPLSFVPVIVAALALLAFAPALKNGFVNWDDYENFVQNPAWRGLSWRNLTWMWTTHHMNHYHPVTWMTLGLDHLVWGMNPTGLHLTSMVWHAATAALFYFLARRLLLLAWPQAASKDLAGLAVGAAAAALFFAVHPLRVESVVWLSERRDVVTGFFGMLTLLAYLRAREFSGRRRRRWYLASVGSFALSLLSKETSVTLVAVLLILDVYPLRRLGPGNWFDRRVWGEKIPYAVLGLAAASTLVMATPELGGGGTLQFFTVWDRMAQAGYALGFHVWKTLWPSGLAPIYDMTYDPRSWQLKSVWGWTLTALLSAAAVWAYRRRRPAFTAAWLSYVAVLSPALGIAIGVSWTYDRYSYLACLGWALLAGAGALWLWQRRRWALVLAAAWLLVLGSRSWAQTRAWRDGETLWRHTIAVEPRNAVAWSNLGYIHSERGRYEEAVYMFQRALSIRPKYMLARMNWGLALLKQGRVDEAMVHFEKIVELKPRYAIGHNTVGAVHASKGNHAAAIESYRRALAILPDYPDANSNLGASLIETGRHQEAIPYLERAVKRRPLFAAAYYNLGRAYHGLGRMDYAVGFWESALMAQPDFAAAREALQRHREAEKAP